MSIKFYLLAAITLCICSCTSIRLAVPDQFSEQATMMKVNGLNSFTGRKSISFGDYRTSKIKRGWHVTSSRPDRNSGITTEERVMKIFGVQNAHYTSKERTKYRYTIQDGNLTAEVFCLENMVKEQLEVKTNVRWIGDISETKNYQYSFSAVVVPLTMKDDEPWQVAFYNDYDRSKDTARRILDLPYVEESGYASNGKDTITIRPVRVSNVVSKSGKESRFPVKILTGYELRIDDGVIAIIDVLGHHVWVYNDLDQPTKLVVASVSSALLLRKVQDVKG
ncbi:hypothetical protein OCK74_17825 [Chitinophagaceae bacterium LB-8]|uniref:Lipoprotein n=1 Tax=Paraflavisolibacter caeni TaxID=2982496 RepID=A0A9X2XYH9_9BACT|nr:hypothetical protein [Paraflavisolibacter caeni]MCU7550982.1 hypothetical protein [Paraflavisolibacter caeni]